MSVTDFRDQAETATAAVGQRFIRSGSKIAVLSLPILFSATATVTAENNTTGVQETSDVTSAVCSDPGMVQLFTGMISIAIVSAIALGIVMFQYQTIIGMIANTESQRKAMKQRKKSLRNGALTVLAVPTIYFTILAPVLGLPTLSCLSQVSVL